MEEKLKSKSFEDIDSLIEWANSKDGTEYIISISCSPVDLKWHIFYIK